MFDTAPFDKWDDTITTFWTFGTGAGTYVLTVLGILLMVGSLIGWVWLEDRKLSRQVDRLRAAGGAGGTRAPGAATGGGNA
jgi:hypothetical protein